MTSSFQTGRPVAGAGSEARPTAERAAGPTAVSEAGPTVAADPAPPGWAVTWVGETGSTNADLVASAARGAPHGTVLVADVQRAGRGRLGRSWVAPPGTALLFSVLLRPDRVPAARRGWIGAVLGVAIVTALRDTVGVAADLKWPNDVLVGNRKLAGILAELSGDALIVGAGINVSVAPADLPRVDATSLLSAGADPARCDRADLLAAILANLAGLIDRWQAAGGDVDASGVRADYLARCATISRLVTVHLPGGASMTGRAVDVAPDGAIVIDGGGALCRFAAGDVQHLRPGEDSCERAGDAPISWD